MSNPAGFFISAKISSYLMIIKQTNKNKLLI